VTWGGLAVALFAAAQAPDVEGVAFVEWVLPRTEAWRGETLRVRVRFGLEQAFLAERLVQPFRRRLDVPVRLLLPGLAGDACLGAAALAADRGVEFALDEDVVRAGEVEPRELDGARFRVFEYALDLRPDCTGALALPAPQLVLTTAESFETDVFGNRTPVEPRELVRSGAFATLTVRALPEAGRPGDFSGGVGTFTLTASARSERVPLGQGFLFDLVVAGRGNLAAIEPPRLEGLEGLRVRGRLEQLDAGRRTFTYELVPTSENVRGVPGVPLVVFDPELGDWRTLRSASVALEVLPPEPEATAPTGEPADAPQSQERSWGWLALPAALLIAWSLRRRGIARAGSDAPLRAQSARATLADAAGDPLQRYTQFLATFLGCAPPAVVGARLTERLAAAGAPEGLARRLSEHHDELTHARYGGAAAPDGTATALADELAAAFD
jgi:hypothetical protein